MWNRFYKLQTKAFLWPIYLAANDPDNWNFLKYHQSLITHILLEETGYKKPLPEIFDSQEAVLPRLEKKRLQVITLFFPGHSKIFAPFLAYYRVSKNCAPCLLLLWRSCTLYCPALVAEGRLWRRVWNLRFSQSHKLLLVHSKQK